ncbi:integral membrane protein [Ilyonectria robusta]
MTDSGLLATIFSGLEPSVALALSCVPYLRPYFGGTFRTPKNTYNSDGVIKSHEGNASNNSRPFEELNDDASEVQLRPMKEEAHEPPWRTINKSEIRKGRLGLTA